MNIYWKILTMHGPINVKFPIKTSKWQMEFNSAFKGLSFNTAGYSLHVESYKRQSTRNHKALQAQRH
jgi:hypothetical protein